MLGDIIIAEPDAIIGFAGAARDPGDDPPEAAARASSAPNTCWSTAWSTWSCSAPSCATTLVAHAHAAAASRVACGGRGRARRGLSSMPAAADRRRSLERLDAAASQADRSRRWSGSSACWRRSASPHKKLPPVVHVAGTNGKGSLVAYLRAMLEAAGYRVHVYTSPHLVRFNERIRVAGAADRR